MNRIENKEKINKITMKPFATCLCHIGQDWYLNKFEIEFYPNNYYPDYMEVDKWINENIEGKELNIEQAVDLIYWHLMKYEPYDVFVKSIVEDCKTHFNVIVEK